VKKRAVFPPDAEREFFVSVDNYTVHPVVSPGAPAKPEPGEGWPLASGFASIPAA
jgi:hypothetical protein